MIDSDELQPLREAIRLAESAEEDGNLPIGAVIVLDREIIATGKNSIWQPATALTRHAELEALRAVPSELWARSREMTLYTTLEPCVMCAGAILLHRIGSISDTMTGPNIGARSIIALSLGRFQVFRSGFR